MDFADERRRRWRCRGGSGTRGALGAPPLARLGPARAAPALDRYDAFLERSAGPYASRRKWRGTRGRRQVDVHGAGAPRGGRWRVGRRGVRVGVSGPRGPRDHVRDDAGAVRRVVCWGRRGRRRPARRARTPPGRAWRGRGVAEMGSGAGASGATPAARHVHRAARVGGARRHEVARGGAGVASSEVVARASSGSSSPALTSRTKYGCDACSTFAGGRAPRRCDELRHAGLAVLARRARRRRRRARGCRTASRRA